MRVLAKFLKPYRLAMLLLIGCVVGQTYTTLALPDYTAKIIDEGVIGGDQSSIYQYGIRMIMLSLIGGCFMVGVGFLASRIATGFTRDVRDAQFSKVEKFSLQEFNHFSTASLITRATNDLQQIQMVAVMLLRMSLMAPIMGIWAIYKAYQLAPSMTWIMATAIITLVCVIGVVFKFALPNFRRMQDLLDQLNLVTRESLSGARVIRAFNKQDVEEARFRHGNEDLTATNLFVSRLMALLQPSMMLILNLTSVAIVWFGSHQVDTGSLLIGNMLAFMQYAMQAIFAFLMMSIVFIMVPRAAISANRVAEVLNADISIQDPIEPVIVDLAAPKSLEFDNVTFSFPGAEEPVLQHISFRANPGETTAIIGSTGSGKSTLINLIPRFYDVTSGSVKVNGVDVRKMALDDLYDKIGYVPQKATLFTGSIGSNLRYGAPGSTDDQIAESARIAQAMEFIDETDDGFASPVSQGAVNFSGGQKQRLSIARALARKPQILIFDDSLSALDYRTESRLRKGLQEIVQHSIVMLVGQRISAIMHAENIIVLDEGKIACQGTHEQLLSSCSVYQEIAASQLSIDELKSHGASFATEALERAV